MAGQGYRYALTGFGSVQATAGAGGSDIAHLYDSAGDDTFIATPTQAMLRGTGFNNTASGFDSVTAHGTAGGTDVAVLYDSAGDDTFSASPTQASLSGSGFSNTAVGFDVVTGHCAAGGTDTARFYDSAGNDRFTATLDQTWLRGEGYKNVAIGFGEVRGSLTNGTDTLLMYSRAGGSGIGGRGSSGDARSDEGAGRRQGATQAPVNLLSDMTSGATVLREAKDPAHDTSPCIPHGPSLRVGPWQGDIADFALADEWALTDVADLGAADDGGAAATVWADADEPEADGEAMGADIDTDVLGDLGLDWLADLTDSAA